MTQFAVTKETTYFGCQKGLGQTPDGREALVFVDLTGQAHVFPFEADDEKKQLVSALTGGIKPASKLDLPGGVNL